MVEVDRLRLLVESIDDVVFTLDREGRLTGLFGGLLRELRIPPEQLQGLTIAEVFGPEAAGIHQEAHRKAIAGEHVVYQWSDTTTGSARRYHTSLTPVRGPEGEVSEMIGVSRDITVLHRVEEELRRTVSLLSATLESTADGILAVDAHGRYVVHNRRFARMWNIPPDVLASGVDERVRAAVVGQLKDPEEFQRSVRELYENPEAEISDLVEFQDGRVFERYSQPQRIEGVVAGRILSFRDVTQRVKAEEALRRSEALLRSVIEGTTEAIFVKDRDGRYLLINSAGARMAGTTPEGLLGRDDSALFPAEAAERIRERDREVMAGGRTATYEETVTVAGVTRTYLSTKSPYRDARGKIAGVIGISRDITERKRTEQAMLRAQKLESLGILAGGVAHDFNNLLAAILGQTSLAMRKLAEDDRARVHVEKAVVACERASDLTRQMLAYSGHGHFRVEAMDLNALVRDNLRLLAAAVPKGVWLESELPEGLPPVRADVGQVQQVLMNLILNAAEAIGERQGRVRVATGVQDVGEGDDHLWRHTAEPLAPGAYVFLEVQDDGSGMDPPTVERIFDPFFTTKFTGRGLGLAAVLGIVRGHAGGLEVESERGHGTRFRLLFPAAAEASAVSSAPLASGADRAVLIIDDEAVVREAAGEMLQEEGIRSFEAAGGRDGLAVLARYAAEIGLVLLDLSMPGMSSEETLRQIRAVAPELPVLLSSGYAETEATRGFEDARLAGFVQKPYSIDRLVDAVRRAMRRG